MFFINTQISNEPRRLAQQVSFSFFLFLYLSIKHNLSSTPHALQFQRSNLVVFFWWWPGLELQILYILYIVHTNLVKFTRTPTQQYNQALKISNKILKTVLKAKEDLNSIIKKLQTIFCIKIYSYLNIDSCTWMKEKRLHKCYLNKKQK